MRTFLCLMAVISACVLSACAVAPPVAMQGNAAAPRLEAVATLSTNACEAAVATDYTAVIVARRAAANALREGKLPLAAAEAVQRDADAARLALDAACPAGKPDAARIAVARDAVARIRKTMGARP